jgi:hypothetical protein
VGDQAADRLAPEPYVPRRRPLQTGDRLQERALARTVGTDDGDDLTVADPKRDTIDGRNSAEVLRELVDLEQ